MSLIFCCFLCNCSKQDRTMMDMDGLIKYFLKERAAVSYELEDSIINADQLIPLCSDSSFVYLLNSSCSMCIYQFVEFYQYEQNMCGAPVFVIIDEGYIPRFEYVMEQSGIKIGTPNLSVIENKRLKYVDGIIENTDLSGALIRMQKGKLYCSCQYVGNIVVDK